MFYAFLRLIILVFLVALAMRLIRWAILQFRGSLSVDHLAQLKRRNALVLDVRTRAEYADGHVAGSLNIPLNELSDRLRELDPARPVIACCASGARSAKAKGMLEAAGFREVFNAGPWKNAR